MFENLNRNGAFSSRVFLLAVLGLGIGPNAALADATDPTLSQGLSDEGVYQLGEVDSVDLVSGNLTVRVPLGPSYPLGGGFSYGLQAVYNANPWERKETATCNPGSGTPPVTFPYFRPTDTSNAGFGWTVGLGRLEELGPSSLGVMTHKYTYVEPDGTRHGFHWELLGRGTEQDRVFFSTGRSLMRLNVEVGTNEDLQPTSCRNSQTGIDSRCIRLEMPDGTFTEFHRVVEDITPLPTNDLAYWLPTYIGDRFGNFLEVDYSAHEWKLEDSQGRLHKVTFDNSEPDRAYNKIQTVELQRFGDDLSTPSAVYSFERSPLTLVRHQFDEITMGDLGCTNAPDSLRQVTVEVLDRLVLPDDSFYAMTYYDSDIGGDCGQCFGGGGKSGAMKTLRLPTALHYEYRYSVQWGYARGGDGPSGVPRPHERVWGVTTKRRYQFDGATEQPMGKWYYDHGQSPFSTPNDSLNDRPPPCYRRTDVKFFTDWDADEMTAEPQRWRTQYYNTAKAGFAGFENLPFSVCQPDQMDPVVVYDDLYLAGETRDPSDGTVLRSNWVRYEVEWPLTPGFPSEGARRLIQSRTVYHDDEDRWTETRSEDWDGFGHYRKAIRHSNFPHSGPARTIETNYVPGFEPTATPVESDTWNFTRYDSEAVYFDSSNVLEKVLYCFAGADGVGELTGFLKGVRRLTGTDDGGGRDLLSLFTEDADGNVGEEAHYGGDGLSSSGSTVGGSDACSAGSYSPTYRLQHSYSSGVRSLTEKVDSDQEVVLVSLDRDIDPATGLVAASRDPSGVQTNFSYDSMSRPVSRRRATNENTAGVFQQYRFPDDADSNGPLEDEARSCGPIVNGFDSCTGTSRLTQFRNLYDRQGRLRQSWARQPWVGSTAERTRRVAYDELDRRVEETTWRIPEDGSDEFSTLYRDFDALDRPGNIRAPDGKETVFTYFGDRATRIQVQVYSLSGFVTSTRTEVRDGFGRLIRVDESSGPGGDNILTTYRYDQRDRLVAVCVDDDADPFDACAGQSRSFAYDRRGLMMSESHPEMEGPVTYGYDPLGQVIEENPAGALETDGLLYRRDAAGRVVRLESRPGEILQEFYFARSNSDDGFHRAGKLYQAKQMNLVSGTGPIVAFRYTVTETFGYAGGAGRLSSYSVRSTRGGDDASGMSLISGYTYNPLGNLATLSYPRCDRPPCAGTGPARTVNFDYSQGRLTGVPGFAPRLLYHGNGDLARIEHANDLWEERERNLTSWKPLEAVVVRGSDGGSELWRHGPYEFDGAGNIYGIGSESYRYDKVNRLVSGSVIIPSGTSTETLTYDRFGNLTRIERDGPSPEDRSLLPSSTTNRLPLSLANYDARGNMTRWSEGGQVYLYDFHRLQTRLTNVRGGGVERAFAYTASGERFLTVDLVSGKETYSARGPDNRLLRTLEWQDDEWSWKKDYIHAGAQQIASVVPNGSGEEVRHLHSDHLGSTRLVTDQAGNVIGDLTTYFPFGPYAYNGDIGGEKLRFTGHERDEVGLASAAVDYMHARYYAPSLGRFLSVDPVLGNAKSPQSWNRYTYALNSPNSRVDLNGRQSAPVSIRDAAQSSREPIERIEVPRNAVTLLGTRSFKVPGSKLFSVRVGVAVEVSDGSVSNFGFYEKAEIGSSSGRIAPGIPFDYQVDADSGFVEVGGLRLEGKQGPFEMGGSAKGEIQSGLGGLVVDSSGVEIEPDLRSKQKAAGSISLQVEARGVVNQGVDFLNNFVDFVQSLLPEDDEKQAR